MKKLLVAALASVLCAALTVPAYAVEHEFGGYWRTRAYDMQNFDGTDSGSSAQVDTRTRLYYTAKFSDDFKFVNKFEFNNTWGDNTGGTIGTDGTGTFRIKHSYIDFNTGPMNFKVGLQAAVFGRTVMFDDDFAGAVATINLGESSISATWMKVDESNVTSSQTGTVTGDVDGDGNDEDVVTEEADATQNETDFYVLSASINPSDALSINPFLFINKEESADTAVYYLGTDIDVKIGSKASVWGTLIYQAGETANEDHAGYLVAAGADAGFIHGQAFYASGDDNATDGDLDAFTPPTGNYYVWAQIMGEGTVDTGSSNNSPGATLSNVMAVNVGTTLKPMDKLTLSADLWYAKLVEEVAVGTSMEDDLGIEIDLMASYKILDNLKLDLIGAYLIAGDATGDEDPIELSSRLSLSF